MVRSGVLAVYWPWAVMVSASLRWAPGSQWVGMTAQSQTGLGPGQVLDL